MTKTPIVSVPVAVHEHITTDVRPVFRLPAEILVLGQRFAVRVEEHPTIVLDSDSPNSHAAYGSTNRASLKITIRGGGVLSEDAARDTLLHEVLHAIIGVSTMEIFHLDGGHGGPDEEKIVGQLAPLLLAVLRDNPELVAALISK